MLDFIKKKTSFPAYGFQGINPDNLNLGVLPQFLFHPEVVVDNGRLGVALAVLNSFENPQELKVAVLDTTSAHQGSTAEVYLDGHSDAIVGSRRQSTAVIATVGTTAGLHTFRLPFGSLQYYTAGRSLRVSLTYLGITQNFDYSL